MCGHQGTMGICAAKIWTFLILKLEKSVGIWLICKHSSDFPNSKIIAGIRDVRTGKKLIKSDILGQN